MVVDGENSFNKRRVMVLYVGGTIGMQKNDKGVYTPTPNAFIEKMKLSSDMHEPKLGNHLFGKLKSNQLVLPPVKNNAILYQIKEYNPLLDSSNMVAKDWIRIAKDIETYYGNFDGFVVLHGTDTLTYTSSALSFMLQNLHKPVILTGAQIPIFETRSDAKDNFLASLILAGCYEIPEVCICFANQLLRGNRTSKISSNALKAFRSPNYHTLADIGIDITAHYHYIRKMSDENFKVNTDLDANVALLHIFPTLTAFMMEAFLKPPVQGLIIESYGAGNVPANDKDILVVLKRAIKRGVVIINVTQCPHGCVEINYETGKILEDIGIIPGRDMTSEAALTKLCYVLGFKDLTYEQKVKLVKTDLRGEITTTEEEE